MAPTPARTFGDGDTLSIDRGTVHGVKLGARFMIFRDIQYGLPLVWVGDAVVMEQGELTSKVVLVLVKDVVQRGDVVVPRRIAVTPQLIFFSLADFAASKSATFGSRSDIAFWKPW